MASEFTGTSGRLPAVARRAQRVLHRVGAEHRVDGVAEWASPLVASFSQGRTGEILRGDWLGHAFHPLATDFTDGPWMAASFLDLFGPPGSEAAARRLVAFGLATSVPTWLSGAVDWQQSRGRDRRVGLLHAATSTIATLLYGGSYLARRRGERRRGVVLGVLGGIVAMGDGYVGGDLSFAAGVGTGRRTTREGDRHVVSANDLPQLETLDELAPYLADDVYLRFSRGPAHDRDRASRDDESGLELPGLSVVALAPAAWWDRPWEDWVARQLCKHVHRRVGADDDRYGWLLRGRVISRGPDGEPLVEAPVPLARLTDRLLVAAEAHYRARFDVGNDSS